MEVGPGVEEDAVGRLVACLEGPAHRASAAELLLQPEALETPFEFGQLATGIDQAVDAGPGGMGLGVDIQAQGIAFAAVGGARFEFAAVGQHHGDLVVVGMDVFFHAQYPSGGALYSPPHGTWQDPIGRRVLVEALLFTARLWDRDRLVVTAVFSREVRIGMTSGPRLSEADLKG